MVDDDAVDDVVDVALPVVVGVRVDVRVRAEEREGLPVVEEVEVGDSVELLVRLAVNDGEADMLDESLGEVDGATVPDGVREPVGELDGVLV